MSVLGGIDQPADLVVDLPNLNSSWPQYFQYHRCRSYSKSRDRSAKFEIILTMKMSVLGVDLSADLGVDLPNLNSPWPPDVSTRGVDLPADLQLDLPNLTSPWLWDVTTNGVDLPYLNSSWPQDVSTVGIDQPADLGVDLQNLNWSWPQDVQC